MEKIRKVTFAVAAAVVLLSPSVVCGQDNVAAESSRPEFVEMQFPQVDLAGLPKAKKGFVRIFDGSSTYGWRGYGSETLPEAWIIEDGCLKFDSTPRKGKSRGDIVFGHKFRNFILKLEWKIAEGGNSGVFYLVREIEGEGTAASGLEAQVLDNEKHPDALKGRDGNRKSSSLYDLIPAIPQNARPSGEWNTLLIKVRNGKVEHWQNGKKVVEYELWTPEWRAMLSDSKFSLGSWPSAWWLMTEAGGVNREGYIALQDHGDDVWYRNIQIKTLD